jgi:biopolymer transport protein ExbD
VNLRTRPVLNLVALMDVFTILVFFFLVHSSDSTTAEGAVIDLPESTASTLPKTSLTLTVTREDILLMGEPVRSLSDPAASNGEELELLKLALSEKQAAAEQDFSGREITILGERMLSFDRLNRVMRICNEAGFADISLTVLQLQGINR